jgi:spermidine synthase
MLLALVFLGGMTTLGVELSASRLLAPFYGNNILVWAVLIGLVLLYLSVGYYLGGKVADRRPDDRLLLKLILLAALLIAMVPFISRPILSVSVEAMASLSMGVFIGSLIGVLILLAIPITLLGFVSPFAIRLTTTGIRSSGEIAGRIYALGTIGSLVGAFLPVLLLIPNIGTRNTFLSFSLILALLAAIGLRRLVYWLVIAIILGGTLFSNWTNIPIREAEAGELRYEGESLFNYIQVQDHSSGVRRLILNNEERVATHSVYYPNQDPQPLSGGPWDYFLLAPFMRTNHHGDVDTLLVIGLGAGTVPKLYTETFGTGIQIDGVEIDPGVIDVGRHYFDMNEPNLNAVVEDGRYFLRRSQATYDVVAIDAYRPPYIPFQLTTTEFFREIQEKLAPDGVVALNAGQGPNRDNRLVQALGHTMRAVFPSVLVIVPSTTSNNLIFGFNQSIDAEELMSRIAKVDDPVIQQVLSAPLQFYGIESADGAFTDDLAPVEQVVHQMILSVTSD